GDAEEAHVLLVLLPALGGEMRLADLRVGEQIGDRGEEVVAAEVAYLLARRAHLPAELAPEIVLGDDRAPVEAVVPHLREVLDPHVVVVLVPPVIPLREAGLEAVEVRDDRGRPEGDADEALPALGDGAARAGAVLLVEHAAGGDDRDGALGDVDAAV